jgi:hypothetical protein
MIWGFSHVGEDVTVAVLSVVRAPVGASIVVVCKGGAARAGAPSP